MTYVVHVWEPDPGPAPADIDEAMQQLEQAWERGDIPRDKFAALVERLTGRHPDITSTEAEQLPQEELAWSDGPLSGGSDPVLVLGLTTAMCDVVQPFVVNEANALGLHVTDQQAGEVYLADGARLSVAASSEPPLARLRRAAEQGDAVSQYEFGLVLRRGGDGMTPDPAAAFRWLSLAAAQEHGFALRMLGVMHAKGEGTGRNLEAAAHCYRDAITHGSLAAHSSLAGMYLDGSGVARDGVEAQRLYKMGVQAGDANSLSGWALMFNRTQREQDQVFMFALRMRAAQLDPQAHGSILEILRERADPSVLAQAEELAQAEDIVAAIEAKGGRAA